MFKELEQYLIDLYTENEKEDILQNIFDYLLFNGNVTDASIEFVKTNEIFRNPKNFRPLDNLQYLSRKSLANNQEYVINKLWFSSKKFFSYMNIDNIKGARILDFGCGVFNPLLQSMILYVNGANSIMAIDIEDCIDYERACFNMKDLLADFVLNTDKWNFTGIDTIEFIARCRHFDIGSLSKGNMHGALKNLPIRYCRGDFKDYAVPNSLDIIISFSVLEHITDREFKDFAQIIYNSMAENGVMTNQVDFSDHRQNTKGYHFWSFMTNNGPDQPVINKLRLSEMLGIFKEVGFSVTESIPQKVEVPEEIVNDLKPLYKKLLHEDIKTISAWFTLKKATTQSLVQQTETSKTIPENNLTAVKVIEASKFDSTKVIEREVTPGWVDSVSSKKNVVKTETIELRGWAVDTEKLTVPKQVVAVCDEKVIKAGLTFYQRQGVADLFKTNAVQNCGWKLDIEGEELKVGSNHIEVYALLENGNWISLKIKEPIEVIVS